MMSKYNLVWVAVMVLVLALPVFGVEKASGRDEGKSQSKVETASAESIVATPATALSGEQIRWQVISSGGNPATSTNYKMSGSVGQLATGFANSTGYTVHQGFWQIFGAPSCCLVRGDIDHNGVFEPIDIVFFVDWLWVYGPEPECLEEADATGNGQVDPQDLVYIIEYTWNLGPDPVPCP